MTIDEKLELFYETAIEDATTQSNEMVEEYEKNLSQQIDEQKALLKEKSDAMFKMESEQLLHEKNKVISLADKDVKKQILEEEKSFEKILFCMVEEKLHAYMQTEEYTKCLNRQIKEEKEFAGSDELIIYINSSDESKKAELESEHKVTIQISDQDFIGGTRAVIRSRNLLIDNSFLAKLNEEKEAYTM